LVDLFYDGEEPVEIPGERHPGEAAHGSGCTHSSAIAAFLARGAEPLQAAAAARQVASLAVGAGLEGLGKGHGPVDVFDLAARARADAESAAAASK
jgi:hydroxymethylpyrimidine/phosphomethylpyrimidine kinase